MGSVILQVYIFWFFIVFPLVFVAFGSIAPPPDRISLYRRCTTLRLLAPKTDPKVVHGLFLYYYASNPLPWLSLLRFLLVYAYTLLIFFIYSPTAPYITPRIERRRMRGRRRRKGRRSLLVPFLFFSLFRFSFLFFLFLFLILLRRSILGVI